MSKITAGAKVVLECNENGQWDVRFKVPDGVILPITAQRTMTRALVVAHSKYVRMLRRDLLLKRKDSERNGPQ